MCVIANVLNFPKLDFESKKKRRKKMKFENVQNGKCFY